MKNKKTITVAKILIVMLPKLITIKLLFGLFKAFSKIRTPIRIFIELNNQPVKSSKK
jgi:hypothetical protein